MQKIAEETLEVLRFNASGFEVTLTHIHNYRDEHFVQVGVKKGRSNPLLPVLKKPITRVSFDNWYERLAPKGASRSDVQELIRVTKRHLKLMSSLPKGFQGR